VGLENLKKKSFPRRTDVVSSDVRLESVIISFSYFYVFRFLFFF
jgi:hypothetical protein